MRKTLVWAVAVAVAVFLLVWGMANVGIGG